MKTILKTGLAAALMLSVAGVAHAQRTALTVHTAIENDQLDPFEQAIEAAIPEAEVVWARNSTGVITARFLAEAANPQADEVLGRALPSLLMFDERGPADDLSWCPPASTWPSPSWGSAHVGRDGVLVRMGSRLLRSCTSPQSPLGERRFRLTLAPEIIPFSYNPIAISTLGVSDYTHPEVWFDNFLRGKVTVGTRTLGGIVYREYDHHSIMPDNRDLSSYFVFERSLNPHTAHRIPDHFISCPDRSPHVGGAVTCIIFVPYLDIVASVMMIGDGMQNPTIPRDKFPSIATDVYRIIEFSDFTDRQSDPEIQDLTIE